MNYSEAKYIVTEMVRIPFYKVSVNNYQKAIDELQRHIDSLTEPSSPNGKEAIGEAKGNALHDYTEKLTEYVTEQAAIEWEMKYYVWSLRKAEGYRDLLLKGENADYVQDYLNTRDKRELQTKYHVGNAYDRMIRIVIQELKSK
jgi:hypothetical protein